MADILIHFFKNLSFPTLQNARVFQMLQGRESLFDRQANKPKGQNQAQVDITDDGSSHKTASLIVSYKKIFDLVRLFILQNKIKIYKTYLRFRQRLRHMMAGLEGRLLVGLRHLEDKPQVGGRPLVEGRLLVEGTPLEGVGHLVDKLLYLPCSLIN